MRSEDPPRIGLARWWTAADLLAAAAVGLAQYRLAVPARALAPIRAELATWQLVAFAAAMAIAVTVRRRWPIGALSTMCAATVFMVAAGIPAASGPALPVALALLAVAYARPRPAAFAALGVTMTVLAGDAVASRLLGQPWNAASVANVALVLAAAWCAAFAVRQQRERTKAARAQAVERAVADERLLLARELHDVVAHGMSVIAVQSGYGCRVFDTRPDQARQALEAIQATSREAMSDLRRMLTVLRQPDPDPNDTPRRAPSPGLADLDTLLARTADAGVHVTLHVAGRHRPLPPGVDLAAYRIVQEALTNVVKHAGPGTCRVALDFRSDDLRIEITDHGAVTATTSESTAGHGLIGMRERVAAYDGDFDAAPLPGRGFRVTARLPVPGPAA